MLDASHSHDGDTFNPKAGQQSIDLTSAPTTAVGLQQTVTLQANQTDTLCFLVGNIKDPHGVYGKRSTDIVMVNGQEIEKATRRRIPTAASTPSSSCNKVLGANARYRTVTLAVALLGATAGGALAPERPVTDSYFGTVVSDPYRYFESGDPTYVAWKANQLVATRAMLQEARKSSGFDAVAPAERPAAKLTNLTLVGGRAFVLRSAGALDELVVRDVRRGSQRTIVTSRHFDSSAGRAGLGAFAVSADGRYVAIHVYVGRAAESDIHVLRVADGHDVEPPLRGTIYDYVDFTPDGRQVWYARSEHPMTEVAVPSVAYDYAHALGWAQRDDAIIFGPGVSRAVRVTPSDFAFVDPGFGRYAVAEVRDVAAGGSRFYAAPLSAVGKPATPWRALGDAAAAYTDYALHGDTIDLATSAGAPNFAIVRASLSGAFAPRIVLPASPTVVVSGTLDGIPKAGIFALSPASDAVYVQLLDRGVARMVRIPYGPNPRPVRVPLPLNGSILQVATDPHEPGALLELTGWTEPGDVYAFDPARDAARPTGLREREPAPARVAEEVTATASDGTSIGVSVVHRPGIALDGSHPLILRVAGAYGFSFTPDYALVPEPWLARGGIYAVAHVRGGGELGESWHRAGMGARKMNTWTDLIAAAQRLVDLGYTSPQQLDLYGTTQSYLGGIASSIAIGRAVEERPDLFAAAVVDVPVFDLLRSERTALGRQSVSEFGSVATRPGFAALLAMSPYEHVRTGVAYPPLLIRSFSRLGYGDDWQAAKMVARLQAAEGRSDGAFLDIAGEGPADRRDRAALRADAMSFFLAVDRNGASRR